MVVSTLQSILRFCEHRDEDGPADAWQRIEDRHVTMLLPLSRHILRVFLGELLTQLVEFKLRFFQLAIDESQSLDGHSDMCGRSLNSSLSDSECRLAQLVQHFGCVETTYSVFLQHASNSRF